MRRLPSILIALVVGGSPHWPQLGPLAHQRPSSPNWSPRPAPCPARRSTWPSSCTRKAGWHGYWLNPGDAGLPMRVEWERAGRRQGRPVALPDPDPPRRRGADELRLRARSCDPRAARCCPPTHKGRSRSAPSSTGSPAPTRSACPSSGESRSTFRSLPPPRTRPRSFNEWRRALPRPLASARISPLRGDRFASRCRFRRASPWASLSVPARRRWRRRLCRAAIISAATGDTADRQPQGAAAAGRGRDFFRRAVAWRRARSVALRARSGAVPERRARGRRPWRGRHPACACSARWPAACCST